MIEVEVKIDDRQVQAQLIRALRRQDPALKKALVQIAQPLVQASKAAAPKAATHRGRGKTLADSIYARVSGNALQIVSNKKYAQLQHWGGTIKPHAIYPRKKHALAFGGVVVDHVHHPGAHIHGKQYIWGPVEMRKAYILEQFRRLVMETFK